MNTLELEKLVEKTAAELASEESFQTLARNNYWPKWDAPWWKMQTLFEMGEAQLIPRRTVEFLCEQLDSRCPHFFPFLESEIPDGFHPVLDVPCHCQLGMVYQVAHACGLDVDRLLPWLRPWFFKYQLADGGLNCDNEAYVRKEPKSSIVSTVVVLEAVLFCTDREFTSEEKSFLRAGANYLMEHELCRRKRDGSLIDTQWLEPCFPHFYEYSVFRAYRFLKAWSERMNENLPHTVVSAYERALKQAVANGGLQAKRRVSELQTTTWTPSASRQAVRTPAQSFELLDAVSTGEASARYFERWLHATGT